jgi:hypothetical protein
MMHFIPVGLFAGLATALLFVSASAGGMTGRIILFFLAPLPCYLAGVGWGAASASIAAVLSALITGALMGARTGAVFFLSQGIPLIVLCHLALLSRPVTPDPAGTPPATPLLEWYPTGRIVAAATLMSGALAFVTILLLGADLESLRALMREMVDTIVTKQMPNISTTPIGETERAAFANLLLHALPAASAVLWLGGFLLNLWLAAKITQISGRLHRAWPDVSLLRFPQGFSLGLALAIALSLLPGLPGLLATGFSGAFLFAYFLMGLAIIHWGTRGKSARTFILWGLYVTLLLFNTWAALIIALIAILEPFMWYRRPDLPDHTPAAPTIT